MSTKGRTSLTVIPGALDGLGVWLSHVVWPSEGSGRRRSTCRYGVVLVMHRSCLTAAGADWEDGPRAGEWIAGRLGPFGPSLGHAVPLGYAAYAIVPIQWDEEDPHDRAPMIALEAIFAVLQPVTGSQPVHCGIWSGWPVHGPDAEPLVLPHREYWLWTGPLRSALAFRMHPEFLPSLVWPEDRAWFIGAPIWTNEIAVAGAAAMIDAIVRHPYLQARAATPDESLDIDD